MASIANDSGSGMWMPDARGSTKEEKIEKWWEVNRKHDPQLTRGATPLVERCMRMHGMNEAYAKRVLKGYRQFMELKSVMNDWQGQKLSPPLPIMQMWEQHLIDNLNYTDDCFLLFGRVIGNDPDASLDTKATSDRIKTTRIAFQARYGDDLDLEVWIYANEEPGSTGMMVEDIQPGIVSRGRLPVAGIGEIGAQGFHQIQQQQVIQPQVHHVQQPIQQVQHVQTIQPALHQQPALSPRRMVASNDEDDTPINERSTPRGKGQGSQSSPRTRASSSKTPPKSPTGNDPITIFLRDQTTGEETYFSLRYRSTLRIVFTVFAERKGLSQDSLKFSFNGQSLTGYETPYSLGLEDRARIDVAIGGRR